MVSLIVSEEFAENRQAVTVVRADAGVGVLKVMDPDVVEGGGFADRFP